MQKYGGTSVGTIDRIKSVARRICTSVEQDNMVVVVVSAMAGVTNRLIGYANSVNSYEGDREYDVIISAGEQVAAGLITSALKDIGLNAKSYSAWQVPIVTDSKHGHANIINACSDNVMRDVDIGIIPVICGFQGVSQFDDITTIGRGGSDLTAVAIAAAIHADMCEIYSDVDGVYTADPNKVESAKLISNINYAEMLEFSLNGAKVLQAKSVDYAMNNGVVVRAASSFICTNGTVVSENVSDTRQIIGICSNSNLVSFEIPESSLQKVQSAFVENLIRIIEIERKNGLATLTVNHGDVRNVCQVLACVLGKRYRVSFRSSEFCNISVVGLGVGKNMDVYNVITTALSNVSVYNIFCFNNSVNVTVEKKDEMVVLSMLHNLLIG